jgi:hypothetical protein
MKTAFFTGAALALALSLGATAASASIIFENYSFTGAGISGSGQLTLDDLGGTFDSITAITGMQTVGAATEAITGLSLYAGADNRFFTASPHVDFAGYSFSTSTLGDFNIFLDPSGTMQLSSHVDSGGNASSGVPIRLSFTSVGGVPEPASWALMILGFGGVGATLRKRRDKPIGTFA